MEVKCPGPHKSQCGPPCGLQNSPWASRWWSSCACFLPLGSSGAGFPGAGSPKWELSSLGLGQG